MPEIDDNLTAVLCLVVACFVCFIGVVLPVLLQGAALLALVKHLLGG